MNNNKNNNHNKNNNNNNNNKIKNNNKKNKNKKVEKGKLEYKGVVYNEMKGAMSDQSSIIDQEIQSNLFTPKLTYHFNSGGDPSEIPSLSYSQLKKFHANFYHPSNSRFFTFGDLPMKMILKSIDEIGLRFFERNKFIGGESEVKNDLSFEEVKIVRKTFPPNPSLPLSHSFCLFFLFIFLFLFLFFFVINFFIIFIINFVVYLFYFLLFFIIYFLFFIFYFFFCIFFYFYFY